MTQVRSISIGVWLTRGSRHETAERGGIAHFVEHMLFKGTATPIGGRHRAGDRFDRRPARRVHRQGIRELLHQGARRASAARDRHPLRHRPQPGVQPRRHRAREEGRRRRDQDGRGHARRSRPRALHAGVLGEPSARPADSRHHAKPSSRSTPICCATTSRNAYTPRNLIVSAVGNLEHDARPRAGRGEVRVADADRRAVQRARAAAWCRRFWSATRSSSRATCASASSSYPQNHDDRYASYVLNTLLGGSMSSRLFQNVREKRGLAYAVFSGLSAYRDAGSFTIYAGCSNEAVGEVIDLVRRGAAGDQAGAGARRPSCSARRIT